MSEYNPLVNLIATGKEIYRVLILIALVLIASQGVSTYIAISLLATLAAYGSTYLLELSKITNSFKFACFFDVLQIICIVLSMTTLGLGVL